MHTACHYAITIPSAFPNRESGTLRTHERKRAHNHVRVPSTLSRVEPLSTQVQGKPQRDAIIVNERAAGSSIALTAAIADCSPATVERVTAMHRDLIDQKRRQCAETFLRESDAVVRALVCTARDSSNRLQVAAFKELSEKLCGWGLKQGDTHVHGDIVVEHVDARSITLSDVDPAALQARRDALGL